MDQRPATVLERAIARGQEGVLDPRAVLWAFTPSRRPRRDVRTGAMSVLFPRET